MAKAAPPTPADDKRSAAVSHVDTKFTKVDTPGGGTKWYPPGPGGHPTTYNEAVDWTQAALLLDLDGSSSQAAIIAALAIRVAGLTEKTTPATP